MERLALEKESLQHELKGLKIKVGEINDQLGMLMETIQAKDEMIMKLSQESSEPSSNQTDATFTLSSREQQEMDILKVRCCNMKSISMLLINILMLSFCFRTAFKGTKPKTSS